MCVFVCVCVRVFEVPFLCLSLALILALRLAQVITSLCVHVCVYVCVGASCVCKVEGRKERTLPVNPLCLSHTRTHTLSLLLSFRCPLVFALTLSLKPQRNRTDETERTETHGK